MHLFLRVSFLLASLITASPLRAQNASPTALAGHIRQEATGAPVAGASVVIKELKLGATSDENGAYRFARLPGGRFTLEISAVGYKKMQSVVTLPEGQQQDFALPPADNVLGEVVITGVSKATPARINPAPVSIVTAGTLRGTVEPNVMDALVKHVPGLNVVKTGPNISKPFIRGLGYNRVLTLYDGLRQEGQQWGDEHGVEVDAYGVEKAEVLKGPASLMFGSDALAGVVSLFSPVPDKKDGHLYSQLTSEYQSNNGLIGSGLKLGRSGRQWLWAMRGSWRLAKNYTNNADGRVYNTGFSEKNASALLGHTGDKGFTHLNATLYDNLQGIPDGSRDSLTRRFTRQVYEGAQDDITRRPVVSGADLGSYRLSPLHQHIQHYRVYVNNHYRIGAGEIEWLSGFQQNIRREYSHPTAPAQAGLFVRLNTFNYSIRYNRPLDASTDISAGINGMQQSNKSKDATDFPIPDYRLSDIGGYAFARWKNERLTISGGCRYDIRRLNSGDFYIRTNPATGFDRQVAWPDTAGARLPFRAFHKTFTGLSASIGLTWQLTDQLYIKANMARGYRAPNITEIASNGLDPGAHIIYLGSRDFIPEYSLQQDLGLGARFDALGATVSVFHNSIQNYIYLSQLADAQGSPVVDAQGNKTFQYRQAAAALYGMEASATLRPAFLKDFAWSNDCSLVYGFNRKAAYKDKGIDGEYLPLVPPFKLISTLSRLLALRSTAFPSLTLNAGIEYNAPQNRYMALYNTETPTRGYALFNAGLETVFYCTDQTSLQLVLQVSNLFNTVYQSNLSRLKYFEYYSASPNGRSGIYGMGRNGCIRLILQSRIKNRRA